MKFQTGQEMLDYLQSGHDLYGENSRCYFFEYNDRGAICRYYIDNDKALELAQRARDDHSYWGAYLGDGGNIHDTPEESPPYRVNNLELCELYCKADEWVDAFTYGLNKPPTVVNEVLKDALPNKNIDWVIHITHNGVKCADCGKEEDAFLQYLANVHTHGMEKYGHRDFQLVLQISNPEIGWILNTLGQMVQAGHRFHNGEFVNGIFEDCPIRLKEFVENGRMVLRVIIPDKHNVFPEDPKCEAPYRFQLLSTDALFRAEYSGLEAKHANETMENPYLCPYCGKEQGIGVHIKDMDAGLFKCNACAQEYVVLYNSESWSDEDCDYTVVEDVMNTNKKSLKK